MFQLCHKCLTKQVSVRAKLFSAVQSIHEGLETSYNDTILLRDYRHILSRCDLKALLAKNTERALVNKMNVVIIEFGTIQHGLTWINSVANRIEHMKRHVDYVHDSL
ncbi:hypothetical protein CRM22_010724 [Opisthorchis felineus]|uniref:Uncharacterized protein n=1 Tax=Opisthorchis felineus TaxID=147828 RepID=A0A4V3SB57_OPIFE|nr:hypothetical protein CRM22_010724 [Opisthorchis felineus]TGZ51646.1 hypothetical protein CRM22_010724 [Opisthorchis felineus]